MKRFLSTFFVIVMCAPLSAAPLISEDAPFWKTKPKVYKKILEERDIIVSVKSVDDPSVKATPRIMRLAGGGVIEVPKKFAFAEAKNFKNMEKMSAHIKRIDWNPETQILFMHSEAFNYHARMTMKVSFTESAAKDAIRFTIINGVFTGMEGVIEFTELPKNRAEIALAAGYRYNKFPVPAFFLEFGLEVVMQKIAARMRSFIEDAYKRCHKENGDCHEPKSSP